MEWFLQTTPQFGSPKTTAATNGTGNCCNSRTGQSLVSSVPKPELDELKLLDNPKFIFNIDETGFPLGGKPVKIVSLVTGRWVWKGEYYCSNLYFWGGRASSAFCDI